MLRVRPTHFTSHLEQWARLLTDIGMIKTAGDGTWQEFDAGSGRLSLRPAEAGSPDDGSTLFGVEVGELEEFARRTNEAAALEAAAGETGANGPVSAELVATDQGPACRLVVRNGFSFLAGPAAHGANCADADPALTVVGVWFTEDTAAAAAALRSIGAHPRPVPDNDETADFTAKNGGLLMVRPATGPDRAGLGFEYDGDLGALRGRLTAAGHEVRLTEEAFGHSLHIANPDGGAQLWVSQRLPVTE